MGTGFAGSQLKIGSPSFHRIPSLGTLATVLLKLGNRHAHDKMCFVL